MTDLSRVEDLFHQARALEPADRAEFLREECESPELRAEVESLLESHEMAAQLLGIEPVVNRLKPGQKIEGFEIVRLLAVGGTALVFEAYQTSPRRLVALKVMQYGLTSESAVRRFRYEAEILARLQHPGIARVLSSGTFGGGDTEAGPKLSVPFFAMELVESGTPITAYAKDRQLSIRDQVQLVAEVCEAVQFGHQNGVIHRDLKPGNILIDDQGKPRVIDFGIAHARMGDGTRGSLATRTGHILGTLQYMSPEQFDSADGQVDTRSDIYSLGVVLYEMVCGRPPYEVPSESIVRAALTVREHAVPRPRSIQPTVPLDLEAVLLKALEKDRAFRYGSVSEFRADLRRILINDPVQARPVTWVEAIGRFIVRRKGTVALAAAAVLMLLTATAVSLRFGFRATRAEAQTQEQVDLLVEADRIVGKLVQDMAALADSPDGALNRVLELTLTPLAQSPNADPWLVGVIHLRVAEAQLAAAYLDRAVTNFERAAHHLSRSPREKTAQPLAHARVGGEIAQTRLALRSGTRQGIEDAVDRLGSVVGELDPQFLAGSQWLPTAWAWIGTGHSLLGRREQAEETLEPAHRYAESADCDLVTRVSIQQLWIKYLLDWQRDEEAAALASKLHTDMTPLLEQDHAAALTALDQVAECVYSGPVREQAVELLDRSLEGWSRRRPANDVHRIIAACRLSSALLRRNDPGDIERATDLCARYVDHVIELADRLPNSLHEMRLTHAWMRGIAGDVKESSQIIHDLLDSGLAHRACYEFGDGDPWWLLWRTALKSHAATEFERAADLAEEWAAKERPDGWWDRRDYRRDFLLECGAILRDAGRIEASRALVDRVAEELSQRSDVSTSLWMSVAWERFVTDAQFPDGSSKSAEEHVERLTSLVETTLLESEGDRPDEVRRRIFQILEEVEQLVPWLELNCPDERVHPLVDCILQLALQESPDSYHAANWMVHSAHWAYKIDPTNPECESLARKALQIYQSQALHDRPLAFVDLPFRVWVARTALAPYLSMTGQHEEAISTMQTAMEQAPPHVLTNPDTVERHAIYGYVLCYAGRGEEGLAWLEDRQEHWREQFGPGNFAEQVALQGRIDCLRHLGREEEARTLEASREGVSVGQADAADDASDSALTQDGQPLQSRD